MTIFASSAFYSVATRFPLSRQIFLWLFNTLAYKVYRSIHSMSRHSHIWLLEHLCCDIDNYVATLFLCSFFKLCRDPVFMSRQYFCWFLLQQCFLYCQHSCRDMESLSRQGLVAIEPIFLLQLHFDVATTSNCVVDVFYRKQDFMSRQDFLPSAHLCVATQFCYVATRLLFLVLESFSRYGKVCRDLVHLCLAYSYVATLISLSRHQNLSSA